MSSRKDLANAIRALSMDAVEKANSGHPGRCHLHHSIDGAMSQFTQCS